MRKTIEQIKSHYEEFQHKFNSLQNTAEKAIFDSKIQRIEFFKKHYVPVAIDLQTSQLQWDFELRYPMGSQQDKEDYIKLHYQRINYFF